MKNADEHIAAESTRPVTLSLQAEAARWVARLTSGDASIEECREFEAWRDADPDRAYAVAAARRMWVALGPVLDPARRRRRARARIVRVAAIAASILMCVLIGGLHWTSVNHDYVTRSGECRTVKLPDGSKMVMAGDTAVDVRFPVGMRQVTVVRGEIFIEVAHDVAHPFTVLAGRGRITDVGTAFSVRRVGDGASIVVSSGEVQVQSVVPSDAVVRVSADQGATYGAGNGPAVQPMDTKAAISWTTGRLILKHRSLGDAVREINRYRNAHLVVIGYSVAKRQIDAVVDLDHIDDWLGVLNRTHVATVRRIGPFALLSAE